jgi:DNA-binding Lrp family transcriptional regulator
VTESALDSRLLDALQRGLPLVRTPYADIAERLGCEESAVLARVAALRGEERLIREISGVFDAPSLGYQQALVAMAAGEERLDAAGTIAIGHPGVGHCYARTQRGGPEAPRYDLWLTLAVSPDSRLGLERTAERLAKLCEAERHVVLPVLRRYKLSVRFGANATGRLAAAEPPRETPPPVEPTDEQRRAVRALQQDLPAEHEPFDAPAAAEGLDVETLLRVGRELLAAGHMRRYAAVVRHRSAGARANVMVAWRVNELAADAAGRKAAESDRVSHCLLRKTAPDWGYNLYTMIHGRDEQDCRMTIDELVATGGLRDRVELWTRREYAKRRVRLFTGDERQWEEANA